MMKKIHWMLGFKLVSRESKSAYKNKQKSLLGNTFFITISIRAEHKTQEDRT